MGCEDFQVILRSRHSVADCRSALARGAELVPDPDAGPLASSAYLLWRDGQNIFEAELSCLGSETELSLRFAVCHPESADDTFSALALRLAVELQAELRVMEDLPAVADENLASENPVKFIEFLKLAIAEKRAYWVADFGDEKASVTCAQALRRYVLRTPS